MVVTPKVFINTPKVIFNTPRVFVVTPKVSEIRVRQRLRPYLFCCYDNSECLVRLIVALSHKDYPFSSL